MLSRPEVAFGFMRIGRFADDNMPAARSQRRFTQNVRAAAVRASGLVVDMANRSQISQNAVRELPPLPSP